MPAKHGGFSHAPIYIIVSRPAAPRVTVSGVIAKIVLIFDRSRTNDETNKLSIKLRTENSGQLCTTGQTVLPCHLDRQVDNLVGESRSTSLSGHTLQDQPEKRGGK